jgi:arylsulfatase A-like enzyme
LNKIAANHFSPSGKQIAFFGLLSFFVFACLENIVCLAALNLYWPYYLVSFTLWLFLALLSITLLLAIHAALSKIFRKSWPPPWLLVFVLFLPNILYTALQVKNIGMPFQLNSFSKFALFFLVLTAYIPAIRYVRSIIKGNHEKVGIDIFGLLLAWGFSSIFGTLITGAELQGTHWLLNTLILVAFHFIIPFLNAFFSRRRKFTKAHFVILNACGCLAALLVLSNIFVAQLIQKAAYGQAKALAASPPAPSPVNKRPNILLIVMDAARAESMSLYGYKRQTTPYLDEFAHDAVVFQNAISSSSWTLPAHATLFTGLPGYLHFATFTKKVADPVVPLAGHYDTLAEILHGKGYKTGAVTANTLFVSPKYGLNQGFEFFWWGRVRSASLFTSSILQMIAIYFPVDLIYSAKKLCGLPDNNSAAKINRISLKWLRGQTQSNKPWFLFVNYMETHGTPYLSAPFSHKFSLPPRLHMPGRWQQRDPKTGLPRRLDRLFMEEARGWYDNEMAGLDHEIGQLLNRLKKLKIYDDTLIVITSDHGELLGEHDEFGHGNWLYQELLHVPLIVKNPREKNGGQVNEKTVQNSDVFAEILDQAGVALPPAIVGQPFAKADHVILSEVKPNPEYAIAWPARYRQNLQSIYSQVFTHYKLIRSDNDKIELYDIHLDENEKNNLIDANKNETILAELEKFLAVLNAQRVKLYKKQPTLQGKLDPDTLRKLRTLGYLN